VGLLRRLLWISDYSVTATDPTGKQKWKPGVLSESAPLDAADPTADDARRAPGIRVAVGSRPQLWWCSSGGGILADGLWAGLPQFGAVVNLDGPHAPRLRVDRRKALTHDQAYVDDLLHREIPALLDPDASVLDHAWVSQLLAHAPRLADEVLLRAVAERRTPWMVGKRDMDVTAVGCFTEDAPEEAKEEVRPLSPLSPDLQEWRHLAWVKAGVFPGVLAVAPEEVPLARPTDVVLLNVSGYAVSAPEGRRGWSSHGKWLRQGEVVPVGHVYRVAKQIGYTPADIATRLTAYGYTLPTAPLPDPHPGDLRILSRDLDEDPPWLNPGKPVNLAHILRAAGTTGRTPTDIATRLTELGHTLPTAPLPDPHPGDLRILSRDLDEKPPWLNPAEPVNLAHILNAAEHTGRTPADIANRLTAYSYALPTTVRFISP
jgi:hypothetical protein